MSDDVMRKLIDDGVISEAQAEEANDLARSLGITPVEALVKLGYVDATEISARQAEEFGADFIDLESIEIPPSVIELVPESMARENVVMPLALSGEAMVIAIDNPNNLEVIDKLRFVLNRDIEVQVAPKDAIQTAINRHYGQTETESVDSMLAEFTETAIDFTATEMTEAETLDEDDNAPIIRLVNLIISEAVRMRASDIHVEPFEDRVRIRYRIDGVLVERDSPPRRLLAALVSRIKIMARIDISEKRRPQDGRIKSRVGTEDFDLRISILP